MRTPFALYRVSVWLEEMTAHQKKKCFHWFASGPPSQKWMGLISCGNWDPYSNLVWFIRPWKDGDKSGRHPKARKGTGRMVQLTDEQKQQISQMSSPKEMETSERKRQYSALRRAIRSSGNPALTTKFETCSDTERWGSAAHLPSKFTLDWIIPRSNYYLSPLWLDPWLGFFRPIKCVPLWLKEPWQIWDVKDLVGHQQPRQHRSGRVLPTNCPWRPTGSILHHEYLPARAEIWYIPGGAGIHQRYLQRTGHF